jgi:hypothetical protein
MEWTYRRYRRHLVRIAAVAGLASIAAACLPQGKSNRSGSQPPAAGDDAGINRGGKADAFQDSVAEAERRFRKAAGGGDKAAADGPLVTATTQQTSQHTAAAEAETVKDTPADAALGRFFRALATAGKDGSGRTVTILHLGDSHIAADRFSGDLREEFQKRFGDAGRGMMMPGLFLARGVKFEQGGQWQAGLSSEGAAGPFGLTGAKLTSDTGDAWLRVTATGEPFTWAEVTLEQGRGAGTILVGVDGDVRPIPAASGPLAPRAVRIERTAREILVKGRGDGRVTLHSVAIGTGKSGVRYVNFGMPGATAATPLSWDGAQVSAEMKRLAPDLIVLGYGTEEAFNDNLNLAEYETKASMAIAALRQAAPQASFLIMGPPDVARRPDFAASVGRAGDVCTAISAKDRWIYARLLKKKHQRVAHWHPPLQLDGVRAALRRVAAAHQAYYWDWSKLMGGTCGIHAWVHSDPPLATANHVYLTDEGSKRSAKTLFRELMTAYDAYERSVASAGGRGK